MAKKKIVFTGQSGIHPEDALRSFVGKSRLFEEGKKPTILSVEDKIREKLPDRNFYAFLRFPIPKIRNIWKEAFQEILTEGENATNDVYVILHACYYTHRTTEYISCVAEDLLGKLNADFFITFIDDIYDIHSALKEPGHIFHPSKGGASLNDPVRAIFELYRILDWRASEIMMTKHLAYSLGNKDHYVFAMKHDYNTLHKLIYNPGKRKFYISHPIREVKRLEDAENSKKASEIKQQIERFEEKMSQSFVCFRPTTIDELRIENEKRGKVYSTELRKRWNEEKYKKPEDLLYIPSPEKQIPPWDSPIDEELAKVVSPLLANLIRIIDTQISARDLKLVEQSDCIAAWRPCFNGNASRGVVEEIKYLKDLVKVETDRQRNFFICLPDTDWVFYQKLCREDTIKEGLRDKIIKEGIHSEKQLKSACEETTIEAIMQKLGLQFYTESGALRSDPASQSEEKLRLLNEKYKEKLDYVLSVLKEEAMLFETDNSLAPSSFVNKIENTLRN